MITQRQAEIALRNEESLRRYWAMRARRGGASLDDLRTLAEKARWTKTELRLAEARG